MMLHRRQHQRFAVGQLAQRHGPAGLVAHDDVERDRSARPPVDPRRPERIEGLSPSVRGSGRERSEQNKYQAQAMTGHWSAFRSGQPCCACSAMARSMGMRAFPCDRSVQP